MTTQIQRPKRLPKTFISAFQRMVNKGKDKDKKQKHYVQKYTEPGLIAEAVIVAGIPYFAISKATLTISTYKNQYQ